MALIGPPERRRSNATNAYDLLTDVRRYACEEPTRLWMGDWQKRGGELQRFVEACGLKAGPACGTIGCIAGNIGVLTGAHWADAATLLGGDNDALTEEADNLFYGVDVNAEYGTVRYVKIVNDRIARFQGRHEKALKSVAVTPKS